MSGTIERILLEQLRFSRAILEISVTPICLPIYVLLLWMFNTKPDFKNVIAYKLIISLGLMDCCYLLQSFIKDVLTLFFSDMLEKDILAKERVLNIFIKAVCSLRMGHVLAVPFLTFVLAVNRFTVMIDKKYATAGRGTYLLLIGVAWVIYGPLVLTMEFSNVDMNLEMSADSFKYDGHYAYTHILVFGGPAFEIAGFFCMLGIVCKILIQKRIFKSHTMVSSLEIRLIAQSLLICFPISIILVTGSLMTDFLSRFTGFYVFWHLLVTLLPAVNLSVYIIFNPLARDYMKKTVFGEDRVIVWASSSNSSFTRRCRSTFS